MELNLHKYNAMYGSFLNKEIQAFHMKDISSAITVASVNDSAFVLNSAITGPLGSVISDNSINDDLIVLRCAIPYSIMLKMDDYETGIYYLSLIKNALVSTITSKIDKSQYGQILFQRPGQPNKFFGHLENVAGCELRCFVQKKTIDTTSIK